MKLQVSQLTSAQVRRVARERLIGTTQLCEALGIGRPALRERVQRETFPAPLLKIGGANFWDIAEVREYFPR